MSGRRRIVTPDDLLFNNRPLQQVTHHGWAKAIGDKEDFKQQLRDTIHNAKSAPYLFGPTHTLPDLIQAYGSACVALDLPQMSCRFVQSYEVKVALGDAIEPLRLAKFANMSVSDYAQHSNFDSAYDFVLACTLTSFTGTLPYSQYAMPFGCVGLYPTRAALFAYCTKYEIGFDIG